MSSGLRAASRRRVRSLAGERGAVAVEFALVLTPLIMILIGTFTTGVSFSHALGITNAVREGARFGAIADASTGTWASDVADRVRATQFDDPTSTETSICVQLWKGPAPGTQVGTTFCTGGGPGVIATDFARYPIPAALPAGVCVVRVVATRNYKISAPPLLPGVTQKMARGSVARYEKGSC